MGHVANKSQGLTSPHLQQQGLKGVMQERVQAQKGDNIGAKLGATETEANRCPTE